MKKKILIIDDDIKLNNLLKEYLTRFDFQPITSIHPKDGLLLISSVIPDIIILDVMMPDMDGFEVLRKIREMGKIPVIMLTARGDVTDRIVGLELGADDYLPKPFEPRELVARIQSVLRRIGDDDRKGKKKIGEMIIDEERQEVIISGSRVEITTMEFDLLNLLASKPGRVFSRENIMEILKGYEWENFDRSVDVLLSRLRQKLDDDPKEPRYIKTIWGKGYQFIGGENED